MLAGISVDYHLCLEQERERKPSAQILESLSTALLLDEDARHYLYNIVGSSPLPSPLGDIERADPYLCALINLWDTRPR